MKEERRCPFVEAHGRACAAFELGLCDESVDDHTPPKQLRLLLPSFLSSLVIIQVCGVTSRPFFKCDVTASALHNDVCTLLVSLLLRLSTSVESRLFSCLT